MSNFEIHELTEKAINRNSNIIHDTLYDEDYETGKNTAGAVADLALEVVASEYDDTASYAIGSYCIYSGVLYRCTTATTGAFDVSDWTAVLITGEYKRVRVMHKADFDLLTPDEQADGMIFVDDVDITASDISYDNTDSGLSADDLQEAVDEVSGKVDDKANKNDFTAKSVSRSNVSVPANDVTTITFTVNNSKFNIITGFVISASSYVVPVQIFFADSTTIQVRLKNTVNNTDSCSVTIYYI